MLLTQCYENKSSARLTNFFSFLLILEARYKQYVDQEFRFDKRYGTFYFRSDHDVPEDIEITSVADMLKFWRASEKDFNLFIKKYFNLKVRDMDNGKQSCVYKTPIWGHRKAKPIRCSALRT
jgi:hypothetical protein